MSIKRRSRSSGSQNPLAPPRVDGLEASHRRAQRGHRRNRVKGRIATWTWTTVLLGVVVGAGYVGYTIYEEQQTDDVIETERRRAEIEAERDGRTTDDLIEDLEGQPRFNGNAPPGFDDDSIIEVIRPPEP